MKVADLDYHLPRELVAQHPVAERTGSKLLVVERATGIISHSVFSQLGAFLHAGDLLVMNNTRVKPARLFARRPATGAIAEVFIVEERGGTPEALTVRAMLGSNAKLVSGERLEVPGDDQRSTVLIATLGVKHPDATWEVELSPLAPSVEPVSVIVARLGRMPLPPYIQRERFADPSAPEDRERYQTVYASVPGAVAAPTAGLHFTNGLLSDLSTAWIQHCFVTLHVGPGTFKPVKTDTLEEHTMHAEDFDFPAETAIRINETRAAKGRVVAVGTTTARVLESCATAVPPSTRTIPFSTGPGSTNLLIQPGYHWRAVDALITNFHLPKSTLLALVMSFAGRDLTMKAYAEAIERKYRFFSYGDAMLVV